MSAGNRGGVHPAATRHPLRPPRGFDATWEMGGDGTLAVLRPARAPG
jgi:hypothetical protein